MVVCCWLRVAYLLIACAFHLHSRLGLQLPASHTISYQETFFRSKDVLRPRKDGSEPRRSARMWQAKIDREDREARKAREKAAAETAAAETEKAARKAQRKA